MGTTVEFPEESLKDEEKRLQDAMRRTGSPEEAAYARGATQAIHWLLFGVVPPSEIMNAIREAT